MRNIIITLACMLIISSCATEELKLELFSPDAFAFSMDDGWELNATVNVKGFKQKSEEDGYSSSVSYLIHLITPTDTIYNVDFGVIKESSPEELMDITIESQIEFNSNFDAGEYQLLIFAEDQLNTNKDTAAIPFTLSSE
jgi:hypothetical protein